MIGSIRAHEYRSLTLSPDALVPHSALQLEDGVLVALNCSLKHVGLVHLFDPRQIALKKVESEWERVSKREDTHCLFGMCTQTLREWHAHTHTHLAALQTSSVVSAAVAAAAAAADQSTKMNSVSVSNLI